MIFLVIPLLLVLGSPTPEGAPQGPLPTLSCSPPEAQIQQVMSFTRESSFQNLTAQEQIFTFELLAAAKECTMRTFLTPSVAQMLFLTIEDYPLEQVFSLFNMLTESLNTEGLVVPV